MFPIDNSLFKEEKQQKGLGGTTQKQWCGNCKNTVVLRMLKAKSHSGRIGIFLKTVSFCLCPMFKSPTALNGILKY